MTHSLRQNDKIFASPAGPIRIQVHTKSQKGENRPAQAYFTQNPSGSSISPSIHVRYNV